MCEPEEPRSGQSAEVSICYPQIIYPLWEAKEDPEVNIKIG